MSKDGWRDVFRIAWGLLLLRTLQWQLESNPTNYEGRIQHAKL